MLTPTKQNPLPDVAVSLRLAALNFRIVAVRSAVIVLAVAAHDGVVCRLDACKGRHTRTSQYLAGCGFASNFALTYKQLQLNQTRCVRSR